MASLTSMAHRDLFGGLVLLDSGISQRLSSAESEALNRLMILLLASDEASKQTLQKMSDSHQRLEKKGFAVHSGSLDAGLLDTMGAWMKTLSRF